MLLSLVNINQKKLTMKKFNLLLSFFLLIGTCVYASFPVKTKGVDNQTIEKIFKKDFVKDHVQISKSKLNKIKQAVKENSATPKGGNDKMILILLWVFLGFFAAHRWYAGKPLGWNILFILTGGGCGVWAIIDLINILMDKF